MQATGMGSPPPYSNEQAEAKETLWRSDAPPLKQEYAEHFLLQACRTNNVEYLHYLASRKCNFNDPHRCGETGEEMSALYLAVSKNNWKCAEFLVAEGAMAKPEEIYAACRSHSQESLRILTQNIPDRRGCCRAQLLQNALVIVASTDSTHHLDTLIHCGAATDKPNEQGIRPLAAACECNSREVVAYLVERCGETHDTTPGCLSAAVRGGSLDVIRYLLDKKAVPGIDSLMESVNCQQLQALKLLVSSLKNPGRQISDDVIMAAVRKNSLELVKTLVEARKTGVSRRVLNAIQVTIDLSLLNFLIPNTSVSVNSEELKGILEDLLSAAVQGNRVDLARVLVKEHRIQITDNLVMLALKDDHANVINCFLENGLFIDKNYRFQAVDGAKVYHGLPLIYIATLSGKERTVELLLERGANVGRDYVYCGIRGHTVLHAAVCKGHSQIVQLLVENSQQLAVDSVDSQGYTPLGYAAGLGHSQICEWLLVHGADLDGGVGGACSECYLPNLFACCCCFCCFCQSTKEVFNPYVDDSSECLSFSSRSVQTLNCTMICCLGPYSVDRGNHVAVSRVLQEYRARRVTNQRTPLLSEGQGRGSHVINRPPSFTSFRRGGIP